MFLTKVKTLTAVFVLMAVLGGGIGLLGPGTHAGPPDDAKAGPKKPADPKKLGGSAKVELVQNKDVDNKLRFVMSINYQDVTLDSVLDSLRSGSRLNIVVDEPALAASGMTLGQPVRLQLEGVTLKTALKHLLHNAGLTFQVEDGVIVIAPETARSERKMVRRVYPVADLVGSEKGPENLIRIIRNSVDRRSMWAIRPEDVLPGGAEDPPNIELASIEYFTEGKALVISQTAEMHEEIERLLMDLFQTKKEQERKK